MYKHVGITHNNVTSKSKNVFGLRNRHPWDGTFKLCLAITPQPTCILGYILQLTKMHEQLIQSHTSSMYKNMFAVMYTLFIVDTVTM